MILKSLNESKSRAKKELRVRLPSTVNRVLSREDRSTTVVNEATNNDDPTESTESGSLSWLRDAQKKFLDVYHLATQSALIGELYSTCNNKIDKHGFDHGDVELLSRAYKDSLDLKKHCLTIELPTKLHGEIRKNVRKVIKSVPETNDGQNNFTDDDSCEDNEGYQSDKNDHSGAETDNDDGSDPKAAGIGNDDSSDDESTGTSGSEETDGYIDYYYLSD